MRGGFYLIMALFFCNALLAQNNCGFEILGSEDKICDRSDIFLQVNDGSSFDFSSGSAPEGWSLTGGSSFSNEPACAQHSDDSSNVFYWSSTTTDAKPSIETSDIDVSAGGSINFECRFISFGGGTGCETADRFDEGITLEYSTNNGNTWELIVYLCPVPNFSDWDNIGGYPQTLNYLPTSGSPSNSNGSTGIFSDWSLYSFDIPVAAQSNSTRFKWNQPNSSGPCCDNWGLDAIEINSNSNNGSNTNIITYQWSTGNFGENAIRDTLFNAFTDTSVFLEVFNNGSSICKDTFTVNRFNDSRDTIFPIECFVYTAPSGINYNQSGTYQDVIPNKNLCDSIITIHLTILNDLPDTFVTACDSFEWYGNVYKATGTYAVNINHPQGCSTNRTLHLTIHDSSTGVDIQTHCDEYTWIDGVTYYESNNTASFILVGGNQVGCDSIVTLNLTINKSHLIIDNLTACDELTWQGETYNKSGTYFARYTNMAGCDSTHQLNLTVAKSSGPTAMCKTSEASLNREGEASITADLVDNGSVACNEVSLSINNHTFSCSDLGVHTVVLTVTDIITNDTATCTAIVNVVDRIAPRVSVNGGVIYVMPKSDSIYIQLSDLIVETDDNCSVDTTFVSERAFIKADVEDPFLTEVTSLDVSGNAGRGEEFIFQQEGKLGFRSVFSDATGEARVTQQKGFPFTIEMFAYNPSSGVTRYLGNVRVLGNEESFNLPENSKLKPGEVYIFGDLQ